jgi:hypothetical protein
MASAHIPMWDIDAPVGKGKPNNMDDVRLVQAMLVAIVASTNRGATSQFMISATGKFDDRMEQVIKAFQESMNKKHPGKYPSTGVVLPIHAPDHVDWMLKSPNGGNSTMAALNFALRALSKDTHQGIGAKLTERLLSV